MKTRSNMPLFVVECKDVKALSNAQIDLLRCGDYLVKKDESGEHAYKVTFKSDTGMCLTYHDASVIETQSYDKIDGVWTYNSEDKTDIAKPSFENIVDKDGHPRFIEGEITLLDTIPSGITKTYGKWTLSGSHLLIVLAGSIADTTVVSAQEIAILDNLPKWIFDKIIPLYGTNVERKTLELWAQNFTSQNIYQFLQKDIVNQKLQIYLSTITLTADRNFRISFDLLIDNE